MAIYEIKPELTLENIKKQVSDWDIFRRYVPNFEKINKSFKSEFREEKSGSARITEWRGSLYYKDFGMEYKGVGWVDYLRLKYGIQSFREILNIVNDDMCLGLQGSTKQCIRHIPTQYPTTVDRHTSIEYTERNWNSKDKEYWWDNYKIHCKTLRFFNIIPTSHIFINDKCIPAYKPTYCYDKIATPKGYFKRKLYSPTNKDYKWTSNTTKEHIQGLLQLPPKAPLLILDKSYKDVVCIKQHLDIPGGALSGETIIPSYDLILYLRSKFDRIISHYDYDTAGIKLAKILRDSFNIPMILNPANTAKDSSDYIKKYGVREFRNMFKSKIEL